MCGLAELPVEYSTKATGVEPAIFTNIVDEALYLYRVNILFRSFELHGAADRTLLYTQLFLQECIALLAAARPLPNKKEAEKLLLPLATQPNFAMPGDSNFKLNAIFPAPKSTSDADMLRKYLLKLRSEAVKGLIFKLYAENEQVPNKWWLSFSKRRFMNKAL